MIEEEKEANIQEYLSIFRRYRFLIICVTFTFLAMGILYNYFEIAEYGAKCSFIIESSRTETVESPYKVKSGYDEALDIREIIRSRSLIEKVLNESELYKYPIEKNKLSFAFLTKKDPVKEIQEYYYSNIRVDQVGKSNVMTVSVTSQNPEHAATVANHLVEAFSTHVNMAQNDIILKSSEQIDKQIEALEQKIDFDMTLLAQKKRDSDFQKREELSRELNSRDKLYQQLLERQESFFLLEFNANNESEREKYQELGEQVQERIIEIDEEINKKKAEISLISTSDQLNEIAELNNAISTNQKLLQTVLEKKEIGELALYTYTRQVRVLDPAKAPLKPLSSKGVISILMFALIGGLFGLGIAYFLNLIDKSFKDAQEVEDVLGLPVLASVPNIQTLLSNSDHPKSISIEAFRTLRTNIKFIDKNIKTLAFTSPTPATGKTLIVTNLGLMMNNADEKTLIIDTDLRKSNLHHMFKIDKEPGLTNYLQNKAELKDIIKKVKDNLYIIPAGAGAKNPQIILESGKFSNLIESLKKQFHQILFDSVPALLLTDAEIISSKVDATILVINAKTTKKDEALATKKSLEKPNCKLIGAVFNNVDSKRDKYYYYHYHRYY